MSIHDYAMFNGPFEVLNVRLENGTVKLILLNEEELSVCDDLGIIHASDRGELEIVKFLIERGANIHAQDDSALRNASSAFHFDITKLLLENGANIHAQNDIAVINVCEYGYGSLKMLKLLIENGANIHAQDDYAIRIASYNGYLHVVKLLYWNYKSESKRELIRKLLPKSKKLWDDIENCELLSLPFELIELIKRQI
jgi:hypothetical protein